MLRVSDRARQELKRILTANTDEPEACLKLTADGGGQLRLAIDMERNGGQAVEHEDSKVLLVEKNLAAILQGITIEVEETAEGARLVVSGES